MKLVEALSEEISIISLSANHQLSDLPHVSLETNLEENRLVVSAMMEYPHHFAHFPLLPKSQPVALHVSVNAFTSMYWMYLEF